MESAFAIIRKIIIGVIIVAVIFLALSAIFAIWDVFEKDVALKSIYSMLLIIASGSVMIITSLIADDSKLLFSRIGGGESKISIIKIIIYVVLAYLIFSFLFRIF